MNEGGASAWLRSRCVGTKVQIVGLKQVDNQKYKLTDLNKSTIKGPELSDLNKSTIQYTYANSQDRWRS